MDHMASILERAEREGAVRRLRTTPEPGGSVRLHADPSTAASLARPADAVELPPPQTRLVRARPHPTVVSAVRPDSEAAEQYRALRTRILHTDTGIAVRILLVTSPAIGEGKSVTAANLGVSLAQSAERRVCLVDANLRAPQLSRLFGLPAQPGLSDVLEGKAGLDAALTRIEGHNLAILPAGSLSARPAELLGSTAMRRALDDLRLQFDVVVVDAPAVLPVADVGSLVPLVDSVVLVVRAGLTTKTAIRDATAAIGQQAILGMVLNEAA